MRNLLFLLVFFSAIFLATSCSKPDLPGDNGKNPASGSNTIDNNTFSPTFDWETSRVVEFDITCPASIIINITSVDGSVRYHRGMHTGNKVYKVKLSIPYVVKQLKVNDHVLDVDSKTINYTIS